MDEQPQWPLSVIGTKENAEKGNELTGEWSPEELRVLAYSIAPRGMSAEVTQREGQLIAEHRAKVDALSRGGVQTQPGGGASNGFQMKDPFAQGPGGAPNNAGGFGAAPQNNAGFGGGFGAGNNGGAPQQQQNAFGQPQQQMQQPPINPPAGNAFGQTPGFALQPPLPIRNAAPAPTPGQESQFSAAQFGFAKVPEAAPPPKYC